MPSSPSGMFLLSGAGMIAVAIVAVLFWRWGRKTAWIAFVFGALAWTVSVGLKFAWAALTNTAIKRQFDAALPPSAADPVFWVYIGLLTGIFECGIALLFVRRTRLRTAGWNDAVAFGIGFGAMEAFVLGLLNLVGLMVAIATWDQLPEESKKTVAAQTALGEGVIPLPVIERLTALFAHVYSCVLIVFGVRMNAWRWFWLSFVYKSALDALAAWGILATQMTKSLSGLLWFEAIVSVFAVVGLVGLAAVNRRFPPEAA